MARTPWLRIAAVSAPPVLAALWLSAPALQPAPVTVTGHTSSAEACLGVCRPVLALGDLRLACGLDFSGVPVACRQRLRVDGPAQATYAPLPTLAGLVGLAPTHGVLLRLERGGETVYRRSLQQQVWSALYGGWVFHAIYWPIAGLILWRWPHSRFSRRVTWADSRPAGGADGAR